MSITNAVDWIVRNIVYVGAIFWELLLYKDLKEAGMIRLNWVLLIVIFCLDVSVVGPGPMVWTGWRGGDIGY